MPRSYAGREGVAGRDAGRALAVGDHDLLTRLEHQRSGVAGDPGSVEVHLDRIVPGDPQPAEPVSGQRDLPLGEELAQGPCPAGW